MAALVKEAMLRILANDEDAQAKLDAISAEADAMRDEFPELTPRINTAEASAKMAVLRGELRDTAASATELSAATDEYAGSLDAARQATANLRAVQADESASADDLAAAMDADAAAADRFTAASDRLFAAEQRTAAGAQEAGDAQLAAGRKARDGSDESAEGAGVMEGAWGTAKLALLGVGGALIYGTYKAAGFQSQMTMLHTQAGVATGQLKTLGAGVLQLAGQVGESPDSLAESLYHVESNFESLGIKAPKALADVKIAAEGARVGGANLIDVTNALTAALASQIPGVQNTSQAMGALNAIVGAGDMKMQDLADAFGTGMVAVVKGYGLSLTDVGAALDVFGDNNIRGAHAGTQLRMAVQALAVPVSTAKAALAALGMTSTTMADDMQRGGLMAALDDLQARFVKTGVVSNATAAKIHADILKYGADSKQVKADLGHEGEEITTIFGKKAGTGIAVLLEQMDRLKSKYPAITKGAHDFGKAWSDTQKTAGQQMKDLEMGAEALVTSLGTKLLPVATKVLHFLADFVDGLEKGSAGATAIAGVIGTVLAGIALSKLASGIKGAIEGFESLGKGGLSAVKFLYSGATTLFSGIKSGISSAASGIGSLIGKFTGAAAAEDELTVATEEQAGAQTEADVAMDANPIGAVIIAITILAGAIYEVVKHWKDFKQWGSDALHWVEDAAKDVWHWFESNWPLLAGILLGPIALAVGEIITHWKDVSKFFEDMWHDITKIAESLWHDVSKFFEDIWHDVSKFAESTWHDVTAFFTDLWHDVTAIAGDLWNRLVNGFERMWHDVTHWADEIWQDEVQVWTRIWHDVVQIAGELWNRLVSGFEQLPGRILRALGDLGRLLWNAGVQLLEGLIGGIKSEVSSVISSVENVGSSILHGIEGALGIGSPSREMRKRGQMAGLGLALGLDDSIPLVAQASARLAAATMGHYGTGGGYGSAAAPMKIQLELDLTGNDSQILTALANAIRVKGGSPDIVRRKVVFA